MRYRMDIQQKLSSRVVPETEPVIMYSSAAKTLLKSLPNIHVYAVVNKKLTICGNYGKLPLQNQ